MSFTNRATNSIVAQVGGAAMAAVLLGIGPGLAAPAAGGPAAAPSAPTATRTLAFLHGEWVGTARGTTPDGKPYTVIQTERVGPLLGGNITLVEGRGFGADGATLFNAFAVISRNTVLNRWEIRSYAMGYAGTFPFELREDGYVWHQPAGPDTTIRYTATIAGDTWTEIGEAMAPNAPPRPVFEMTLRRKGPTRWPADGGVDPAMR